MAPTAPTISAYPAGCCGSRNGPVFAYTWYWSSSVENVGQEPIAATIRNSNPTTISAIRTRPTAPAGHAARTLPANVTCAGAAELRSGPSRTAVISQRPRDLLLGDH